MKRQRIFATVLVVFFLIALVPITEQVSAAADPYAPILKEYRDLVKQINSGKISSMSDYYNQNYRYTLDDVARCAIEGQPGEGVHVCPEYALADIDDNGKLDLIIGGPNVNGKMDKYSIGCICTQDTRGNIYWPAVSSSFMDQEEIIVYENGTIEIDSSASANEHDYWFIKINVYRPGVENVASLSVKNGQYRYNGESVTDTVFYQTLTRLHNNPHMDLSWETFGVKTSTEEALPLANHFNNCVNSLKGFRLPQYQDYIDSMNIAGADRSIVIPGLTVTNVSGQACNNMVPQGICFDGSYYLMSAYCYDGSHNSVLYVIDPSGKYVCTIDLGIKSHVGSLCCNTDRGEIYLADCFAETLKKKIEEQKGCVIMMSIDDIRSALTIHDNYNKDCVSLSEDVGVNLSDYDHLFIGTDYHADYVDCTNDGVWIGTFKNILPKYGWIEENYIKEYSYDKTLKRDRFRLGFASQGAHIFAENEKYKDHSYVFNSCSTGLVARSTLKIYSVYEDHLSGSNALFNPDLPASFTMPVLSEDLEAVGSHLFTMYESGANEYRKNGVKHIHQDHSFGRATCADIDSLISAAAQQIRERYNRRSASLSQDEKLSVIDEGKCGENLEYLLYNDGTLNICGTGDMYDYSADDPAPWQSNQDMIREIYIGEGVTSIGEFAFYGCAKAVLFDVSRSDNGDQVIEMKQMSLADCGGLETANLPKADYIISDTAFLNDTVEIRTEDTEVAAKFEAAGQKAHVHNWTYQETVAPSCSAYGYDIYTCACGEEEYGYAVEPTEEHKFKEVERTKASYASGGEILYECTKCGEQYSKPLAKLSMTGKAISRIVKGKKSMTVKWKKRTKKEKTTIKGYQVRYSMSKKFTKSKTKTKNVRASATKVKIKKLKSKKTYYVQLRTYTKENGVKYYSKWSKTKKVTVK